MVCSHRCSSIEYKEYQGFISTALFVAHQAVNALAAALFTVSGQGDIEERLKEFLALASSSLLKLGLETLDKVSLLLPSSAFVTGT